MAVTRVTTLPLETYWIGQYKQACNILLFWLYFYFVMQGKVSVSLLAKQLLSKSPKFLLLEKGLWSLSLKSSSQFQTPKNSFLNRAFSHTSKLGTLSLSPIYIVVTACMKPKLAKRGNWWNYSQYSRLIYACTMCKLHCFLWFPFCL